MNFKVLFLALFLLPGGAFAQSAGSTPGRIGTVTMAPEFVERDITNMETISLKAYRGKVVMLNFWGPWCPPCRLEVPDLKRLQAAHKDTLVIIGAAVFSSNDIVERFYNDFTINYPVFYGSFDLMDKYGQVSSFPTTILIDREGAIAGRVVGARTRDQYEEMLKPLFAE
jgi:cytochrome c biogenesis protein CcmG/thiol:disulfide interchange protein DsbE